MIKTYVSNLLRIRDSTSAVINSASKFTNYHKVGNSTLRLSLLGERSFHGESCMRYRYRTTCLGKVRCFHTTPTNNLHPLIWVVLRPIAKLSAMVVGRGVRKWWSHLPQNKRALFMQALNRRKFRILGTVGFIGGAAFVYYESHLQEVPIIKRRRFIAFNTSQILEIAEFQYKMCMEDYDGLTLAANHHRHKRVQNVANRIINANRDIPEVNDKSWEVTVVADLTANAFVLPSGQIFIFTGMLDTCYNDDQLGAILGHEMAHAVLNHGAETMSHLHLVDLFTIAIVGVIWAIVPTDLVSIMVQWMLHKFVRVFMELPYSRQLETEADEIGLNFAAKACFDVRECPTYFQRLASYENEDGNEAIKWLSTHPDNEARSKILEEKLPQAMALRLACKCPPLPTQDPTGAKNLLIQPK